MQLSIVNENVKITWEWYEQLLTFNFNETFVIPINHIAAVTITEPASSWAEIRCPGTGIPGIIKAGTFYSNRGKEFWYVTQDKNYLTLELRDEPFQRIILTIDNNHAWAERISQFVPVAG
ncbi:hypothetical protein Nos7524_3859 [Nostoc sp. PCC 7524]|uniref:hypothetical protein n=1 Tax=Nostoc sp. (strain ATCC 29411 / PCC 7524) TaxID=28072 RepID=UPI00029EFE59|nr:hypothetical protein [Nostoc sp. PCC 7524]AFY49633.1 hypothetical protein Nos7524_3859 [Nostoc sp. PCC 7524]